MPVDAAEALVGVHGAGAAGEGVVLEDGFEHVEHGLAVPRHGLAPALLLGEAIEGRGQVGRVPQVALEAAHAERVARDDGRVLRLEQLAQEWHGARLFIGHHVPLQKPGQLLLGIEEEALLVRAMEAALEEAREHPDGFGRLDDAGGEGGDLALEHLLQGL